MSALPAQTYIAPLVPGYVPLQSATSTGLAGVATISTINSDQINLDGQTLNCTAAGGGTLLINGVAVTSVTQNVSSVQNWAQFPALSTIRYTAGGGVLNLNTGTLSSLTVVNSAALSTVTASGTLGVTGLLTSANLTNTGLLSTLGANVSSINGQRVNFYDGQNVLTGSYAAINDSTQNISVSGLSDGLYIFYLAGDTTVGKEFVFPFNVSGGTAYAGTTVFNIGPSYNSGVDYGSQNSMSCKGNAATTSKTIGIYYKSTVNPSETLNYFIEKVGSASS